LFPVHTLSPTKANLRILSSSDSSAEVFSPSPRYNTSILLDTSQRSHLLACHALNKSCPAFKPALALWRIWGEQRGLIDRSGGGLNGWGWTGQMVLGMAVEGGNVAGKNGETKAKKGLGRGLTEWQLFKAGLEFLGESKRKLCGNRVNY
jgi:U3 small nucleolar RNA-associated protein 22